MILGAEDTLWNKEGRWAVVEKDRFRRALQAPAKETLLSPGDIQSQVCNGFTDLRASYFSVLWPPEEASAGDLQSVQHIVDGGRSLILFLAPEHPEVIEVLSSCCATTRTGSNFPFRYESLYSLDLLFQLPR